MLCKAMALPTITEVSGACRLGSTNRCGSNHVCRATGRLITTVLGAITKIAAVSAPGG
jgi:hypothetical protein